MGVVETTYKRLSEMIVANVVFGSSAVYQAPILLKTHQQAACGQKRSLSNLGLPSIDVYKFQLIM